MGLRFVVAKANWIMVIRTSNYEDNFKFWLNLYFWKVRGYTETRKHVHSGTIWQVKIVPHSRRHSCTDTSLKDLTVRRCHMHYLTEQKFWENWYLCHVYSQSNVFDRVYLKIRRPHHTEADGQLLQANYTRARWVPSIVLISRHSVVTSWQTQRRLLYHTETLEVPFPNLWFFVLYTSSHSVD